MFVLNNKKILFFGALLIFAIIFAACQEDMTRVVRTVTVLSSPLPTTPTILSPTITEAKSPTETEFVSPEMPSPTTSPTQTPQPSITPTETPQPSITPTETPPPSATPSATPRGSLNWVQEKRLYEASLKFLAENEDEATIIVRDHIDYLAGIGEHPSLVCGPLSAVILRDAGLLPPDVDLHGFWLLDPRLRPSQVVLETYFPPERYEWYKFDTGTHKFDFEAFPLLPGDFIYLYAGINGTFDHIITVSRVDEDGRAYTVSNIRTDEGFVIRELMLYDPNNPGTGQFYDWMNREINKRLGMTGDGGFDIWRPVAPVEDYAVR